MTAFLRSLRAEAIKFTSLRSSRIAIFATVAVVTSAAYGVTALTHQAMISGDVSAAGGLEPESAFLMVVHYGQIGAIFLGASVFAQERDNGAVASSLLAVPDRRTFFFAKALSALAFGFAAAIPAVLGSYAARCAVLDCRAVGSLTSLPGGDLRLLAGYIVYWSLISLLSFLISSAFRSGIVGLCAMLALTLAISPYLLEFTSAARFLPDQAGAQLLLQDAPLTGDLGPMLGLLVLLSWIGVFAVAGFLSVRSWAVNHAEKGVGS